MRLLALLSSDVEGALAVQRAGWVPFLQEAALAPDCKLSSGGARALLHVESALASRRPQHPHSALRFPLPLPLPPAECELLPEPGGGGGGAAPPPLPAGASGAGGGAGSPGSPAQELLQEASQAWRGVKRRLELQLDAVGAPRRAAPGPAASASCCQRPLLPLLSALLAPHRPPAWLPLLGWAARPAWLFANPPLTHPYTHAHTPAAQPGATRPPPGAARRRAPVRPAGTPPLGAGAGGHRLQHRGCAPGLAPAAWPLLPPAPAPAGRTPAGAGVGGWCVVGWGLVGWVGEGGGGGRRLAARAAPPHASRTRPAPPLPQTRR